MAKPILIAFIPRSEYCSEAEWKQIIEVFQNFQQQASEEYYILPVVAFNKDEFDFKIFSDRDIEPIELEKLKEELMLKLKV